jgi:ribosome maturation factor RimP
VAFQEPKERIMKNRLVAVCLAAVALVLFVGVRALADEKQKDTKNQMEGKIVRIEGNKIVMTDKDGKNEHTHTLAADAKVSLDGKDARLTDLKKDQMVRVTTKEGDPTQAVRIEALDKNKDFGGKDFDKKDTDKKPPELNLLVFADDKNQMEGKIVRIEGNKIVMVDKDGKNEHTHTLALDAKVLCDGKECKLTDLKKDQAVRVTTKEGDATQAVRVEALDKNKDFGPKQ